jgi:HEAT repeat protein
LLCASAAHAQGIAVGVIGGRNASEDARSTPEPHSLRGLFGVPVAEKLLASNSPHDRLRGVVRLGAIGTPEAIDVLTNALEQSTIITRDARARLEAIRALAPFASRENVRALLIRELGEGPDGRGSSSPLTTLTRGAAALALAKTGEKTALSALVSAVVQGGVGADAATLALVEYPPTSLSVLLDGRRRIDPAIANLMATMGDMRAQERLRTTLGETDPAVQTAAALALVKLGDATPVAVARVLMAQIDKPNRAASVAQPQRRPDALISMWASDTDSSGVTGVSSASSAASGP